MQYNISYSEKDKIIQAIISYKYDKIFDLFLMKIKRTPVSRGSE